MRRILVTGAATRTGGRLIQSLERTLDTRVFAVDDRIEKKLYRQGKILGGVYTGRGQEAISVACMAPLIDGDLIIPSHRDMGAYIARGML